MNTPALGLPANASSSLEPYVQLLRALLPRLDVLSVFNARGELYWSSQGAVEPEMIALVPGSISAAENDPGAFGEQRLVQRAPVYLFWLRREDGPTPGKPFAVVTVSFRSGAA